MILILSSDDNMAAELLRQFAKIKVRSTRINPQGKTFFDDLYNPEATAIIFDSDLPGLHPGAYVDLLNSISQRLPVVVMKPQQREDAEAFQKKIRAEFSSAITLLDKPTVDNILATLDACGALGERNRKSWRRAVPYYNPIVPTKMLVENGGVGILTVDASSFRKLEIEYGSQVFTKVKEVFQRLLNEMWGRPGCFRATDILCRRSDHGNVYYIFLNRSRSTGSLPLPGVLEHIADRLSRMIHNALWTEVLSSGKDRRLPACIKTMPNVVVGFASAMYNPCLDSVEVIETAIETSSQIARIQMVRVKDRHKELMHTLIQSDHLLYPNYQAVFELPTLTRALYDESKAQDSIKPLEKILYGFESLVRVRVGEVKALMGSSRAILEPEYLRPDVLFATAKATKVALELDQACLRHAISYSKRLPGWLMVNILPRNLYFIEYLTSIFKDRKNVILEVSESEAINNFELVKEVQTQIADHSIRIAADDFGIGFAGLARVMEINPFIIKFDRSLIENIHLEPVKRAYVQGLVEAARILKTKVLAEGVELWEEAVVLQGMGIDYIQGFLLHRPEAVELILNQLADEENNVIDSVA